MKLTKIINKTEKNPTKFSLSQKYGCPLNFDYFTWERLVFLLLKTKKGIK